MLKPNEFFKHFFIWTVRKEKFKLIAPLVLPVRIKKMKGHFLAEIRSKRSFKAACLSILYTAFKFATESPYDSSTA